MVGSLSTIVIFLLVVGGIFIYEIVWHRDIAFVAEDGHSLPFAPVSIFMQEKIEHQRTDNAGNITIPRFGVDMIKITGPRYVDQSWDASEIDSILVVKRTFLGSSLDKLADQLLKPASE